MPDVIQFRNGNQIKNSYDAGGQKLGTEYYTQKTNITPLADGQIISQSYNSGVVDQDGNAYIGNVEYHTQNGNSAQTTLSRIYNPEGYTENLGNPQYYYYRKDHLGNNREVWLANTNTTKQWTQYYPSGLPMTYNDGDNPGQQQRKYNGKEFVEMHGYDTYDYGARGYYAAIGGWPGPDPLAELFYSISPYAYCMGNSMNYVDNNGMWPTKKVVNNGWVGNRGFSLASIPHPRGGADSPHPGQDFTVSMGNEVHSLAGGKVLRATWQYKKETGRGWGWFVEVQHDNGYITRYAHLSKLLVNAGDRIENGFTVGLSGQSGGATGPHLHMEIMLNGKPIPPLSIEDLQALLNGEEFDNENNPYELDDVVVSAKNPNPEKTFEQRLSDFKNSSSLPNQYGNSGRYNKPNRYCDQFYSDEFLKWYYNGDSSNDSNNK